VPDSLNCVKESTYPVRYLSRKTLKAFCRFVIEAAGGIRTARGARHCRAPA
jgi:hypothetical protein